MSDRVEKLLREYDKNVLPEDHSRSVGLFTIPEYPELEAEEGMWSTVLDVIFTSLRYLAPATLLTIFWGQQSFLFKILKYIDSAFRALIFSSEEQKQGVIEWLSEAASVRVADLDTVWRHGWILCGILDGALPGACAGHPPSRLSLKHAQAIADNYLGVKPMFTRQELESSDALSKHQEWKLTNYLDKIRLAMAKLTPPSAPKSILSNHTTPAANNITVDYVARGSGLTAAQINVKTYFKIYPTNQQSLHPGEVDIFIKGPKNICGSATVSPILGKAQLIRETLHGLQSTSCNYTENILPLTQGTTYLRNYGKNDMNKTFYIPKTKNDVQIEVEQHSDHVRVGYVVPIEGKYEIIVTSNGENIVGSPFTVTASNDIIGILARESFSLEDGEEIDIVDIKTDRKAILRIVDFVTEKMLLKENGSLEKITDEDAKKLMELDIALVDTYVSKDKIKTNNCDIEIDVAIDNITKADKTETKKFYDVAQKILTMNRVCNIIKKDNDNEETDRTITKQKDIPDVVNSTFYDHNLSNYNQKRDKIIIPENISVSLFTERPIKREFNNNNSTNPNFINTMEFNENLHDTMDDDNISIDTQSTNNPFLNEVYDTGYKTEKSFGSFITNEYETNNSQNEESHSFGNPFIGFEAMEKTQPYRTREYNDDYFEGFDANNESESNETTNNETTNPFTITNKSFADKEPLTDFIIGAPVSLPPIVGAAKTNEDLTFEHSRNVKSFIDLYCRRENEPSSFISTQDSFDQKEEFPTISPFHSLGSDTYDFLSQSNLQRSRDMSPKELWDSAYVSIDENSSTPDNNNNSSDRSVSETSIKNVSSFISDFNSPESFEESDDLLADEPRCNKWEYKRQVFTPIIEENEKIISSCMKDTIDQNEIDEVSKAFGELNDIYDDIFSNIDDASSIISENEKQNSELEYIIQNNKMSVDSASEDLTDVKRHIGQKEGSISEVQIINTESISASQCLHAEDNKFKEVRVTKENTQFGDPIYSNIVLEKKKYWDEKIRQIEAKKLEESKVQQKRKRLSSKHLRYNDSLSKRKGKQMVKNFLNLEDEVKSNHNLIVPIKLDPTNSDIEKVVDTANVKLVEEWKSYWDNRLEIQEQGSICKNQIQQTKDVDRELSISTPTNIDIVDIDHTGADITIPTRTELSEEVFKAFETCPKRFFGTSRKHILNKIENFLGKPYSDNKPIAEPQQINNGSGLVSSRISLFHKFSNTEQSAFTRNKPIQRKTPVINSLEKIKCVDVNSNKQSYNDEPLDITLNKDIEITSECNSSAVSVDDCRDEMIVLEKCKKNVVDKTENIEFNRNGRQYKIINNSYDTQDNQTTKVQTRKKSFSKSEMDIFNKTSNSDDNDDIQRHKSVEELPKINIKSFILLYEDVSRPIMPVSSIKKENRKFTHNSSSSPGTPSKAHQQTKPSYNNLLPDDRPNFIANKEKTHELPTRCCSVDSALIYEDDKKYSSLSDIELEIIEQNSEKGESVKSSPTNSVETSQTDYKNRFKMAKQYFQSLEELRIDRSSNKHNECKIIVNSTSTESLEGNDSNNSKRVKAKRTKLKSHSMPSSEISKIWQEMQDKQEKSADSKKLIKISEKFNVDDFFEDVMEGRLSRQGSLRGIPHKKAVLEAFKSMENITNNKLNSYEMTMSQLTDFAKEYKVKNAQTYLSEYPYLPMTDPSKYQPRFDANASGLITYTELLKTKPRRNSVPDLRMNATFTENL